MPYRNRVTPDGDLVAVPDRGLLTGNRGVLHGADGRVVRRSSGRRWICCLLEFRGRRRPVMVPGRYTHLFFLDEVTALAAGHRPCAECRRPDHERFRRAWASARGLARPPGVEAMDAVLHAERAPAGGRRTTWRLPSSEVPDGAMVVVGGGRWLVRDWLIHRWTAGGYRGRRRLSAGGGG